MTEGSVMVAMWASMASWFTPTSLFLFVNLVIGTIALSSRFTSQKNPNQQPGDNPAQQLFRASSNLLERFKSVNFSVYRSESLESATFLQQHSEQMEQEEARYRDSNGDGTHHQLARAPSVLERIKSFNFSFHPRYVPSEAAQDGHYQNLESASDSDDYTDNPAVKAELELYRAPAKVKKSVREKPETKPQLSEAPAEMKKLVIEKPETKPQLSEAPAKMKKSVSETPVSKPKYVEAPAKMTKSASEKMRFWRTEENEGEENVEQRRPATVREERTAPSASDDGVDEKADDFINKFRNQLKLQRLDSLLRYKDYITRGSSR